MPWQSLNASRTRRSETPAALLRSLSVTLWYRMLAAYRTHAHTMCKLAGRTRGASRSAGESSPRCQGPGHTNASHDVSLPVGQRHIDDPQLAVRYVAVVSMRIVLLAGSTVSSPTRRLRVEPII